MVEYFLMTVECYLALLVKGMHLFLYLKDIGCESVRTNIWMLSACVNSCYGVSLSYQGWERGERWIPGHSS